MPIINLPMMQAVELKKQMQLARIMRKKSHRVEKSV
jgi:hypothetical protein